MYGLNVPIVKLKKTSWKSTVLIFISTVLDSSLLFASAFRQPEGQRDCKKLPNHRLDKALCPLC